MAKKETQAPIEQGSEKSEKMKALQLTISKLEKEFGKKDKLNSVQVKIKMERRGKGKK